MVCSRETFYELRRVMISSTECTNFVRELHASTHKVSYRQCSLCVTFVAMCKRSLACPIYYKTHE
jgi:hypothetical protein